MIYFWSLISSLNLMHQKLAKREQYWPEIFDGIKVWGTRLPSHEGFVNEAPRFKAGFSCLCYIRCQKMDVLVLPGLRKTSLRIFRKWVSESFLIMSLYFLDLMFGFLMKVGKALATHFRSVTKTSIESPCSSPVTILCFSIVIKYPFYAFWLTTVKIKDLES